MNSTFGMKFERGFLRNMKYISTRGNIEPIEFSQAVMMGLATDGGLLLPDSLPSVDEDVLAEWQELEYQDLAFEVMSIFAEDVPREVLKDLITRSYAVFDIPEVTPLVSAGDHLILELFHGPTLAFKDVALQFLGNFFSWLLEQRNEYMNILGATSGDTGSAAIYGVKGKRNINIFILHPHGRVSRVQALQMTTVPDKNVFNIAVKGTFDDCQAIVKAIFNDLDFKAEYRLGAINSINWARVLAQVVYYVFAALKLKGQGADRVHFSVPTGNFGDIFAGYIAKRLIDPVIGRLILATNENNILTRFVMEGIYERGRVVSTISPSMDIQIASNFERYLYYLYGEDPSRVAEAMKEFEKSGSLRFSPEEKEIARKDFISASIDQEETVATIAGLYRESGYVIDPHTAVGVAACRKLKEQLEDGPVVCLATAHPCKFPEAVAEATGKEPQLPEKMKGIEDLPQRLKVLPASTAEVKRFVEENALK